jgi:hypothetical protein
VRCKSSPEAGHPRRRRRIAVLTLLAVGAEVVGLWLRTGRIAGRVVVRCRDGHLFTTLWIPGGSAKALRLGWFRIQRCPVGHHWSLVTPVRESDLSEAERRRAHAHQDRPIP